MGAAQADELSCVEQQVLPCSATLQWWKSVQLGQRQDGSAYNTSEANVLCIAAACSDLRSTYQYQEKEEIYTRRWG